MMEQLTPKMLFCFTRPEARPPSTVAKVFGTPSSPLSQTPCYLRLKPDPTIPQVRSNSRPGLRRRMLLRRALTWNHSSNCLAAATYGTPARDDLVRVDVPIHDDSEEPTHHFFPRHFAVVDGPVGIGIELVIPRIIVVRVSMQLRSLRNLDCRVVSELPV